MAEKNDFYRQHSLKYLEMALSHTYSETPAHPDGYGKKTGVCRDTIEMFLVVRNDRLESVTIATDGCLNTHACGNCVAHLTTGKTVEEAWKVSPEAVADYMETLPEDHYHCAELAVGAFYLALADYGQMKKSSWKKGYRQISR
jgi:nitrogen fixation protein NifU and related proteins